ncbi:MAG: hypothetical protein K0S47_982 [Herbinix sp.]|jgi:uncharacterized protein YrzB (UPF0473 family)|nr:hypothetical protein [Herbinix sp.]
MSKHNHDGHDCGCGHDHDHEHDTITLSLDDGTELNCIVLDIFPVEDKDYIALLPEDAEGEDSEVFLYRYIQEDDGEPQLLNIDDDDEFEAVADAFDEILDSQEYDDMFDEEEEEEGEEEEEE